MNLLVKEWYIHGNDILNPFESNNSVTVLNHVKVTSDGPCDSNTSVTTLNDVKILSDDPFDSNNWFTIEFQKSTILSFSTILYSF